MLSKAPLGCPATLDCQAGLGKSILGYAISLVIKHWADIIDSENCSSYNTYLITNLNQHMMQAHFDGLVQERHNSIANKLELCLSCTNPSIWWSRISCHCMSLWVPPGSMLCGQPGTWSTTCTYPLQSRDAIWPNAIWVFLGHVFLALLYVIYHFTPFHVHYLCNLLHFFVHY